MQNEKSGRKRSIKIAHSPCSFPDLTLWIGFRLPLVPERGEQLSRYFSKLYTCTYAGAGECIIYLASYLLSRSSAHFLYLHKWRTVFNPIVIPPLVYVVFFV